MTERQILVDIFIKTLLDQAWETKVVCWNEFKKCCCVGSVDYMSETQTINLTKEEWFDWIQNNSGVMNEQKPT